MFFLCVDYILIKPCRCSQLFWLVRALQVRVGWRLSKKSCEVIKLGVLLRMIKVQQKRCQSGTVCKDCAKSLEKSSNQAK